ncbi:uncharacterized protein [Lolium perenne]|uniref:uncharacterized protein isoform X2 n=1 Tax=Lolium perenne TaxID=4522 RepID=UPI0021F63409|nr:uncharacterized protein LOC127308966 isoform X2 [Lolium perenne]
MATAADAIPSSCRVTPFDKKHPPPAGHVFLSSLPPLPEAGDVPEVAADAESEIPEAVAGQDGAESDEDEASDSPRTVTSIPPANSQDEKTKGKRKRTDDGDSESSNASKQQITLHNTIHMDEEEAPEDPADDPAKNLSASIKIPSKTLCSQEETVNSDELERAKDSPWAPPKEKLKEHDANKGIKISENPPMPSMDDPIAREMMDMAIKHIRFRNEAESLKVSLKKSQHRADELEAKLEAAKKALEEARAKATTAEEKLAEEKSKMATHKADIRLRLDTLNASFTNKIGHSYEMPKNQKTDPAAGLSNCVGGEQCAGSQHASPCTPRFQAAFQAFLP